MPVAAVWEAKIISSLSVVSIDVIVQLALIYCSCSRGALRQKACRQLASRRRKAISISSGGCKNIAYGYFFILDSYSPDGFKCFLWNSRLNLIFLLQELFIKCTTILKSCINIGRKKIHTYVFSENDRYHLNSRNQALWMCHYQFRR